MRFTGFFDALITRLVDALLVRSEFRRLQQLRGALKSCGNDVAIRMPVVIEVPWKVSVGNAVSLGSFLHVWGNAGVWIGDRTMVGSHVSITTATHDSQAVQMSASVEVSEVRIANDVWIGTHAVIFPGVTIGEHAIVAAGAVVRDDVAPYEIVAGVPARHVRFRLSNK